MDSKYAKALGIWEFTVNNVKFELKPSKGDNLRFLRMQESAGSEQIKLIELFVPYMTEIVARAEPESSLEEIETFVERNVMAFLKETMIAYGWITREKWDSNEAGAIKKSLESAA